MVIPPRPCSPACSDISSIGGDVFSDTELIDQVLCEEFRAPGNLLQGFSITTLNMDAVAEEIEVKSTVLNRAMRNFTLVDVSEASIETGEFNTEFNKVKDLCNETVDCIAMKMLIAHRASMSPQQIDDWSNRIILIESTVSNYKADLRKKFTEVKTLMDSSRNTASVNRDMANLSIGQSDRRNEKLAEAKELFEQV